MSIKQDLDNELKKIKSDNETTNESNLILHEEDKKYLDEYLEKNKIIERLKETVNWAIEQGLGDLIIEHKIDDDVYEYQNKKEFHYAFKFNVKEKRFRVWEHSLVKLTCFVSDANWSRKSEGDRVYYWRIKVGQGEDKGSYVGKTEIEMFEIFKKVFFDLIKSKTK